MAEDTDPVVAAVPATGTATLDLVEHLLEGDHRHGPGEGGWGDQRGEQPEGRLGLRARSAQSGTPRRAVGQYAHVVRSDPSNGRDASLRWTASRRSRNVAALVVSRDLASIDPA